MSPIWEVLVECVRRHRTEYSYHVVDTLCSHAVWLGDIVGATVKRQCGKLVDTAVSNSWCLFRIHLNNLVEVLREFPMLLVMPVSSAYREKLHRL